MHIPMLETWEFLDDNNQTRPPNDGRWKLKLRSKTEIDLGKHGQVEKNWIDDGAKAGPNCYCCSRLSLSAVATATPNEKQQHSIEATAESLASKAFLAGVKIRIKIPSKHVGMMMKFPCRVQHPR